MAIQYGRWCQAIGKSISIYTDGTLDDPDAYHVETFDEVYPEHREAVAVLLAACPDLYDRDGAQVDIPGVGEIWPGSAGPTIYIGGSR